MIKKILIANRAEIALRIIKTAKELNIKTLSIYSNIDKDSLAVKFADESAYIGQNSLKESYLNIDKIINIALERGCDAIHPGYGFLSENSLFAKKATENNIIFIGPSYKHIDLLGDKIQAKNTAKKFNIPLIDGFLIEDLNEIKLKEKINKIGYPVLVKAKAGGGGKGMRIINNENDLNLIETAKIEANNAFGDSTIYIEKYLKNPKHLEVQILADKNKVLHIGYRDCSMQSNHQKVIEECPGIEIDKKLKENILKDAIILMEGIGYKNAATVEFLIQDNQHYFIEVNTRIQVEHPITEEVYEIDLIKEQINIAQGNEISFNQEYINNKELCYAIECRINAKSAGVISKYNIPSGRNVRIENSLIQGYDLPPFYDSMIAKVISKAKSREQAIKVMLNALDEYVIEGINTNIKDQKELLNIKEFRDGSYNTKTIDNDLFICNGCNVTFSKKDFKENLYTCFHCQKHYRMPFNDRLLSLVDDIDDLKEIAKDLKSQNPLNFLGYKEKIEQNKERTNLDEAIKVFIAKIDKQECILAIMSFDFLGGSMASIVGERIAIGIKKAIELKIPMVIVSASGGARMQEGIISLMQMAKTSHAIALLNEAKLLLINVLTDPTTGGVSASFASLGDIIIAEKDALIGFAGPRVIKNTIKQELPEGFQSAEFQLKKGFVDILAKRKELKNILSFLLKTNVCK